MRKVNFERNIIMYIDVQYIHLINPLTAEIFQSVANRLKPNSPELHLKMETDILFHFFCN